jgi:predicted HTH domain antitoxin
MEITVQIPDDIAAHGDPGREVLEALVVAGYRAGVLTHHQASRVLGLTRFELDGFLKARGILEFAYDVEDLERDVETMRKLRDKGLSAA